jgi:hypothetical protein
MSIESEAEGIAESPKEKPPKNENLNTPGSANGKTPVVTRPR